MPDYRHADTPGGAHFFRVNTFAKGVFADVSLPELFILRTGVSVTRMAIGDKCRLLGGSYPAVVEDLVKNRAVK